jgi:predicted AAA+ superfamily ATPase
MQTKELFKKIIVDFHEHKIENVFERDIDIYLSEKGDVNNLNKIVSLIGVGRSGKTFALYSLINRLRVRIDTRNITYINFEDDRLFPISPLDVNGKKIYIVPLWKWLIVE